MLNAGSSGPPFAPYERQKASKLGRSRIEGIPEGTDPIQIRSLGDSVQLSYVQLSKETNITEADFE